MRKAALSILVALMATIAIAQSPPLKKVSAKEIKAMMDSSKSPMIINFWATYCGPCIREIPYFETIVQQSSTPVKLVLISLDMPRLYPARFKDFLKRNAYKSEMLLLKESDYDYSSIDKQWGGAIPASIFIDNSKKYYRLFNTQLTEQRLELELKNMLDYVVLPPDSR